MSAALYYSMCYNKEEKLMKINIEISNIHEICMNFESHICSVSKLLTIVFQVVVVMFLFLFLFLFFFVIKKKSGYT